MAIGSEAKQQSLNSFDSVNHLVGHRESTRKLGFLQRHAIDIPGYDLFLASSEEKYARERVSMDV